MEQVQSEPVQKYSQIGQALSRVSQLISDGGITLFNRLAGAFPAFISDLRKEFVYDPGALQVFREENIIPGPFHTKGKDNPSIFNAYYRTRFASRAQDKAEFSQIGNLIVGLHEQT